MPYKRHRLFQLVIDDPEQAAAILRRAYIRSGGTLQGTADALGISVHSVYRYVRRLGIWHERELVVGLPKKNTNLDPPGRDETRRIRTAPTEHGRGRSTRQ
jgi:hypothetical protein